MRRWAPHPSNAAGTGGEEQERTTVAADKRKETGVGMADLILLQTRGPFPAVHHEDEAPRVRTTSFLLEACKTPVTDISRFFQTSHCMD